MLEEVVEQATGINAAMIAPAHKMGRQILSVAVSKLNTWDNQIPAALRSLSP
jgi:hypothetical protein